MFVIFGPGMSRDDGLIAFHAIADEIRENMERHKRGEPLKPGWLQIMDLTQITVSRPQGPVKQPLSNAMPVVRAISTGTQKDRGFFGEGLGDTIASVTKIFGLQPCGGCERRRLFLNRLVPWKRRKKGNDHGAAYMGKHGR